jgi:hypothetical protein
MFSNVFEGKALDMTVYTLFLICLRRIMLYRGKTCDIFALISNIAGVDARKGAYQGYSD